MKQTKEVNPDHQTSVDGWVSRHILDVKGSKYCARQKNAMVPDPKESPSLADRVSIQIPLQQAHWKSMIAKPCWLVAAQWRMHGGLALVTELAMELVSLGSDLLRYTEERWTVDLTQGASATYGPCPLNAVDLPDSDMGDSSPSPRDYGPLVVE